MGNPIYSQTSIISKVNLTTEFIEFLKVQSIPFQWFHQNLPAFQIDQTTGLRPELRVPYRAKVFNDAGEEVDRVSPVLVRSQCLKKRFSKNWKVDLIRELTSKRFKILYLHQVWCIDDTFIFISSYEHY